ncbi:hypothetical protein PG995_013162 [Apiospora arundinis]
MPSRPGPRSNPSFFAPQPDPLAAADDEGAFEYVGPDSFPDPPRSTFQEYDEDDPADRHHHHRHARRRKSNHPRHRSRRASSQPPPAYSSRPSSPTMSRRTDDYSPPRRSRSHRQAPPPAYSDSESDGTVAPKNEKGDKWAGIKSKGRRGLSKLGRVASTYAAAQMAGGGAKSNDRERSLSRDTYDDRRSGRGRGGRSRYSPRPRRPPRRRVGAAPRDTAVATGRR